MSNINRDYLIINDVKKSNIKLDNGSMFFYITDKNTQNIFVNLVFNISNNDLIQKYANIENAEDYTLTMNIVKPDNTYKIIEGKLHDKEKAIFEFNLNEDCCDEIGTYKCELLTKCNIDNHEEITTSNKLTYKVKSSVLNDLDDIVNAPEYPLVIQLFDKLSDIEQYEEDRRANELARQLAEEQRQTRFDALDADMVDRVTAMDDKMVDVENRVSAKEQAVDKLIIDTKADIDEYKVAKDQEIDEYKATKDTEINNAITAQDNKIDEAISNQNDRIAVVENNDATQNNRLDTLENRATQHESRLTDVEVKNQQQDNRLDIVENKNQQQDNRLDVVEAKNVEQDNRLNDIEAIDVAQNSRLDAIEVKNQQQDDRLLDIEKTNKRQDMNLKCLFAESKNNMIDITEEGNSIYLQNSTVGYSLIDELKGNTLVNCNKEPNKELILNGNINTQGDNSVTITEGVDSGKVDVALEGNTLVNVSKTKDSTALPLDEELTYLYANTQYTVQFISDKATTVDITLGGTPLLSQSIVAGLNRINITTPSELVDNKLVISGVGANISEVVVTDTDREFGYFEGMKSVGECEDLEVKSGNKNLFYGDIEKGFINQTTGLNLGWGEYFRSKEYIPCNPNTRYSCAFKYSNKLTYAYFFYYDKNKKFIKSDNAWSVGNSPSDCQYIRISGQCVSSGNTDINKVSEVILEKGTVITDYIPHQSNTQQLTHEPLRAVGDVKDRYVLIDGKWYIERNCGEVSTFKIINNWSNDTALSKGLKLYNIASNLCNFDITSTPVSTKSNKLKCNTFNYINNDFKEQYQAYLTPDGNLCASSYINTPENDIINYLSDCKVIYPLSTPTYEPINYNPFTVYSGTTHISNNSTIPCNMTIKNTGFNCLLKPSTTYTISSNLGLNTVTTPSTLTEDCLRFMDTDTSSVTTMKDVLVLEGDWTSKADLMPSNFSGIESTFEQELVTDENDTNFGKYRVNVNVVGKNLFDINKIIVGEKADGKINRNYSCSQFIKTVPNATYYLKNYNNYKFDGIVQYSRNKVNLKSDIGFSYNEGKFTTGNNCYYIKIQLFNSSWATFDCNVQLEQGNTATAYEPYKENNITFYINEPLRGIGDAKDKVFIRDDKVVVQRNCGVRTYENGDFGVHLTDKVNTVYPLAEPTYEEVEYNDTKLFIEIFKNSTLFYNSNVPVTSKLYYSYSVPIVDAVAQTANVTDQQDSMIIDLATQVAVMEMMLM